MSRSVFYFTHGIGSGARDEVPCRPLDPVWHRERTGWLVSSDTVSDSHGGQAWIQGKREITMELFDALGPSGRSAPIRTAIAALELRDETERGAIFTKREVVEALLDLSGYVVSGSLAAKRLLEPSFGGGDFLLPALDRLLTSFEREGGTPADIGILAPAIRAIEIHPHSFHSTQDLIRSRLLAWGADAASVEVLCSTWLVRDDFLLTHLTGSFDYVIGNPPYVRQERIAAPLLAEYRRRYETLWERADIYIPFYERGLRLLAAGGILAYICANRWIKNRYGSKLRDLIAREYHLKYYIDLEGADAFHSEVIAYPSVTVIQRAEGTLTKVATGPEITSASLRALVGGMLSDGEDPVLDDHRIDVIENAISPNRPWILHSDSHLRLVRAIEERFPTLESAGCRVGIGVATGADRVFVGDYEQLAVEPSRKIPLAMARDVHEGFVRWSGKGLVNPFEDDGKLVDLDKYPELREHFARHRDLLQKRHCAQRSSEGWYRTIDRVWPNLTSTPKLLVPDIKGGASIGFDPGQVYPHHNLYWVTSTEWDLPALGTVLRSSLALLFIATYCTKMSGGFLRFQAQYLRRIRIPPWNSVPEYVRARLRAASALDPNEIDDATFRAFGFTESEAVDVQRLAQTLSAKL